MRIPRFPAATPGRSGRASPGRQRAPGRGRRTRALGAVAMAGLLALLGSSVASAAAGTPPPVSAARWQHAIKQLTVPGHGCFTAFYPAVQWQKTRCTAAPRYPYPPAHGHRAQTVGNGADYSAEVSGGPLSSVTGSFDSITPGTTETGQQNGVGPQVPNTFSLQLNAKPFSSPACAGSGTPATCQGWQQFIYSTTYNEVFMQYWLLNYDAACPAGWLTWIPSWNPALTYCYTNSSASTLTGGALTVPNLPSASMTGSATVGGNDSVVLTTGTGNATAVGSDDQLHLATAWTGVEFAIVGDCCATQANFSAGTTLAVRTTTHNGTTTAPTCVYEGFTGETNNLDLAPTPAIGIVPSPTLVSYETSSTGPPSCATAAGDGDTHLRTFRNLLYDFQASGDFEAVTTGPNFIVQNRQVSGAPAWPNAAVNQAIAAQIGPSRVAVCTAPTRLEVNGKTVSLGSGGQLNLPGGGVTLNGNMYVIQDATGDSVTAAVNNGAPNWINAGVGLGRWPETVHGLLANAGTNVNAIAASNGSVLTAPFNFSQFYGSYGNSWRVSGNQDLLTACGPPPVSGNPQNVFYSGNLPSQTEKQAQAICLADGVQATPLLDACTVDEAVLGQYAPSVYQTMPPNVTWGKISPPGGAPALRP